MNFVDEDKIEKLISFYCPRAPDRFEDWFRKQGRNWLRHLEESILPFVEARPGDPPFVLEKLRRGEVLHRFVPSDQAHQGLRRVSEFLESLQAHTDQATVVGARAGKLLRGLNAQRFKQLLELAEGDQWQNWNTKYLAADVLLITPATISAISGRFWRRLVSHRELNDIGDQLEHCYGEKRERESPYVSLHQAFHQQKAHFYTLFNKQEEPLATVTIDAQRRIVTEAKVARNGRGLVRYRRDIVSLLLATKSRADLRDSDATLGSEEDDELYDGFANNDLADVGLIEPAWREMDLPSETAKDGWAVWRGRRVIVLCKKSSKKTEPDTWVRIDPARGDWLHRCTEIFGYGVDVHQIGTMLGELKSTTLTPRSGRNVPLTKILRDYASGTYWRDDVSVSTRVGEYKLHKTKVGVIYEGILPWHSDELGWLLRRKHADRRRVGYLRIADGALSEVDLNEEQITRALRWSDPNAEFVDGMAPLKSDPETRRPILGVVPTPNGWTGRSKGWSQVAVAGDLRIWERSVLDTACASNRVLFSGTSKRRPYAQQWIVSRGARENICCGGVLRKHGKRKITFQVDAHGSDADALVFLLTCAKDHKAKVQGDLPPFVFESSSGNWAPLDRTKASVAGIIRLPPQVVGFDPAGNPAWSAAADELQRLSKPIGYCLGWEIIAIEAVIESGIYRISSDWDFCLFLAGYFRNGADVIEKRSYTHLDEMRSEASPDACVERSYASSLSWTYSYLVQSLNYNAFWRVDIISEGTGTIELEYIEELEEEGYATLDLSVLRPSPQQGLLLGRLLDLTRSTLNPVALNFFRLRRSLEGHIPTAEDDGPDLVAPSLWNWAMTGPEIILRENASTILEFNQSGLHLYAGWVTDERAISAARSLQERFKWIADPAIRPTMKVIDDFLDLRLGKGIDSA